MDFYKEDVDKVWMSKVVAVFHKYNDFLWERHRKLLKLPAFEIVEKKWGSYKGGEFPVIKISRELLNDFGMGACTHVIGHEMAHMIVDKFFHMDDLKSHGEAFKKACGMLAINPQRLISAGELNKLDLDFVKRQKIVKKVKKLIALSESSIQAEADSALTKAHELMLRHNINSLDENKAEDYFSRPVGQVYKRMPNYVRDIANMVSKYYFVNHIVCYHGRGRYYEFFGTKENLDMAEYIFCCLIQQGEKLWEEYRKEKKSFYGRTQGIFSKSRFLEGLVAGYSSQLREKKAKLAERDQERDQCTSLIWMGDNLCNEMYSKAYPNMRHYSYTRGARGAGYGDGTNVGKNLRISKGLRGSSESSGRLIRG